MSEQSFRVGLGAKVTVDDRAVTIKNGLTTRIVPVRSIASVERMMGSVLVVDNAGQRLQFGAAKRSTNAAIVDAILDAMDRHRD